MNTADLRDYITATADKGAFLSRDVFLNCADLDGSLARSFLADAGFTVIESGDKGSHGFAKTECGLYLSTNGYITRK